MAKPAKTEQEDAGRTRSGDEVTPHKVWCAGANKIGKLRVPTKAIHIVRFGEAKDLG